MTETTRRQFLRNAGLLGVGAALALRAPAWARPHLVRTAAPSLKLSCCAYSYRRFLQGPEKNMSVEDFVRVCADAGLDGVELTGYYFPEPVTAGYLHGLKRTCYLLGMDIVGTGHRNSFTVPPGEQRDKEIAWVKTWVDYAVILGAPFCRVFAGDVPPGASREQAIKWCAECLDEAGEYAGRRGVMLGVETHGGITDTAEHVTALMEAVTSDWVALNLDPANFHTPDPYADTAAVAKYACTVHLKTQVRPQGKPVAEMDFGRIADILRGVNYRGYLSIEHEANEDPREAVPRYAKVIRAVL